MKTEDSNKYIRTIVSFADIHFGSRDSASLYNELTVLLEEIKTKKPDIIAILGDLFDKGLGLSSDHVVYCNKFIHDLYMYSLESNCAIVLLEGTLYHDRMQLNSYSQYCGPNFRIYNTTTSDIIKDVKIWMIPEEYEDNKHEYYKKYLDTTNKHDFAFGHGMASYVGFFAQTEAARRNKIVWEASDFDEIIYGLALFGHIHISQRKGKHLYIGSTSRDEFGQEKPKGVYVHKYDTFKKKIVSEEFIENKLAPIYLSVNAKELPEDQEKMFEQLNKLLTECFKLRVVIDSDISESKYYNLRAFETSNKASFVILKKLKGTTSDTIIQNEKADARRKERETLLNSYKDMDFYQITKKIAKEKYDTEFTTQEINEILTVQE